MKNKKVLVTGGSGFIGSHLVNRLLKEGADVTVMSRYNSVEENIRLKDVWNQINVVEADLRDIDSLRQLNDIKPEIIFHLAAYNHVGASFVHVSEVFDVNAKGTANLLEAYGDYELFIYTSTSEIYGLQEGFPFKESFDPKPISPYAISKYAGELYCRMKQHISKNSIAVLRPFNVFGPYQSTKAIIPELIISCLKGKTIKTTEGKQTREFNFVDNIIDGFILAAKNKKAIGHVINVGSGKDISIRDLVKKIAEMTNSKSKLDIGALPYRPTEIWKMATDNTRAKEILGWEPKVSFEEGLKRTIEWFRSHP